MANLSIIKTLLRERGLKIKDFCADVGLTEQGLAKLMRTNSTKIETLEAIARRLDVPVSLFFRPDRDDDNPETLAAESSAVAGGHHVPSESRMDRRGLSATAENEMSVVDKPLYMSVPVVPVYAHAGYLTGYGDDGFVAQLPTMPVVVDHNYNGNYMVFEVKGDSMDDGSYRSIMSGDKVMAREVRQEYWQSQLHIRQWFFVIVHRTEGILVKQIIDHNVATGDITCHSLNPLFRDFVINLSDVAQLYNVVQIVSREMRL